MTNWLAAAGLTVIPEVYRTPDALGRGDRLRAGGLERDGERGHALVGRGERVTAGQALDLAVGAGEVDRPREAGVHVSAGGFSAVTV